MPDRCQLLTWAALGWFLGRVLRPNHCHTGLESNRGHDGASAGYSGRGTGWKVWCCTAPCCQCTGQLRSQTYRKELCATSDPSLGTLGPEATSPPLSWCTLFMETIYLGLWELAKVYSTVLVSVTGLLYLIHNSSFAFLD